jgi:hypothetical protein
VNTLFLVLTCLTLGIVAYTSPSDTVTFDKAETGKLPAGWTAGQTGIGRAIWTVVQDATAPSQPNAVKQSGTATYPICVKDDTSIQRG